MGAADEKVALFRVLRELFGGTVAPLWIRAMSAAEDLLSQYGAIVARSLPITSTGACGLTSPTGSYEKHIEACHI